MTINEFHLEEYKHLLEDRSRRIQEIRKLEILVVGGIAAVYAWFSSASISSPLLWCVPILLPAFGLYRALMLRSSVGLINSYIREIEREFHRDSSGLKGYETWRKGSPASGVTVSSYVFWGVLLLITIFAPLTVRQAIPVKPTPAITSSTTPKN